MEPTEGDREEELEGLSALYGGMRSLRDALRAAAQGDFSIRLPDGAYDGLLGEVAAAFNAFVSKNEGIVWELDRVRHAVLHEGRTQERAYLGPVGGGWAVAIGSVNALVGGLSLPLWRVARALEHLAEGDLVAATSLGPTGDAARGDFEALESLLGVLVRRLRHVSGEVSGIVRRIGVEGQLGGRARVGDLRGTWKEMVDDVNLLSSNLTDQVRSITQASTAVARGDLSQKVAADAKGEILELKKAIDATIDQLRTFAAEVIRVAREVGTEGKLGAQAQVREVSGTWLELVDSVNFLARNLTLQVRNIAQIATAIATGDLSQKITVEARGEVLDLKNTINAMVDQLRTFAGEVTRVAREVGTEGKLGGQAQVPGVAGTWQELTASVNTMASNLTSQVRGIAEIVTSVARGDLSRRLVLGARGEIGALADTINGMTNNLQTFAEQVTTVAREVGIEGQLGGQALVPGAAGTWRDLTDSVNMLAGNLTAQVRNLALVTTAVANGDLSKKITVGAKGEIEELKETINAMVDRLRTFAAEVTRVAREVGTEGQLGGQASVPGVSGTWKDLTDSVNGMASNLTAQVRGIGRVVTAVANGDLSQRLVLVAKGEIATLADTINDMTDTLRTFADQVTSVAREVGIEGKLGGQAKVPGASGTWRDLTDNVNQLAANLTTQVRSISEVATAVIQGDLSGTIDVEALGEVLALKDTINQMIEKLRDTTRTNREQDWLKTNLATFFGIMQGQRSLGSLADKLLSKLTPAVGAQRGAFYLFDDQARTLNLMSTYAHVRRHRLANRFALGEGLVGQCALEKKSILVSDLPDDYLRIGSGLGEAAPRQVAVMPVLYEGKVKAVVELASFKELTPIQLTFLEQLMLNVGLAINLIGASTRTEQLLEQLQGSNVELDARRKELEEKADLLEVRNREIAEASRSLEGKAEELTRVSQYKSQFLANMSHEIRTPLNSMMILAQMLAANPDGRLSAEQQEWASTIHAAGKDLLALINQVLDLAKVESGRVEAHPDRHSLEAVRLLMERTFRPVALQKGIDFTVEQDARVPATIFTDRQLLDQILLNLLSNAFKFTEEGRVTLTIDRAPSGRGYRSDRLARAPGVIAFAITDTGIGIPPEQQQEIFEAFRQVDGSMTRRFEGTGLGLTISREFARVLGGEITVESQPGRGSTFTLYLPLKAAEPQGPAPPAPGRDEAPSVPEEGETSGLKGKKAVVVEDDVRNLYAMTSLLERLGMVVIPASSARSGLRALEDHPDVDVVLMDLMMPEMDGYQATKAIRSMPKVADVPVIVLTAKTGEADRAKSLEAGCDDFLLKPVEIRDLEGALLRNLR